MTDQRRYEYDAIVIGSGPNGLSAAVRMAQAGLTVHVIEGHERIGGGSRTLELTEPGYLHDICSAIHPMGVASPYFKTLPLEAHGLTWIYPEIQAAHPLDEGGEAALLYRDIEKTAASLGRDKKAYLGQLAGFVARHDDLMADFLGPAPIPPKHPFLLTSFGLRALWPATWYTRTFFKEEKTRAAFAGMAAHSVMPLHHSPTAAFGLMFLVTLHNGGWPMARGGSQAIVDALASYLKSLGGSIACGHYVKSFDELPLARIVMFDTSPRTVLGVMGERLPAGYREQLQGFRYAPGLFKVDYALSEPIPWKNPAIGGAATVHIGGTQAEIAASEDAAWKGRLSDAPFVLLAQQSQFDPTRAPEGKHTAWAYCHVPHGSTDDRTDIIDAQIERFAPGFKDVVIARATHNSAQMEAYNPNYIGGDITGGVPDLRQLFTRPSLSLVPYRTAARGVYICSASTPPGGGVHGMGGFHAAEVALRDLKAGRV